MSKISAQVVAHSKSAVSGDELVSLLTVFPRYILAELNTHRMLSKNSASSRAIPFKKMVEAVKNDPFIPIAWQKDHKGMQGTEYLSSEKGSPYFGNEEVQATNLWLRAKDEAIRYAEYLNKSDGLAVTKQLCNRLLEPFMWHTVLITGNLNKEGWLNFFELRCPRYQIDIPSVDIGGNKDEYIIKTEKGMTIESKSRKELLKTINSIDNTKDYGIIQDALNKFGNLDWLQINKGQADIHMMALAEAIYDAINESTPRVLEAGEWHIPFWDKINLNKFSYINPSELVTNSITGNNLRDTQIRVSTAMAARTSYTIVGDEKEFTYEQQIALHDRMVKQVPFHASPFEHCAKTMNDTEYYHYAKTIHKNYDQPNTKDVEYLSGWCRNFKGFIQHRHILESK